MMENQYVKQFPDLMAGKTILYVHGFGSSGQSGTVTRLRTVFPRATVVAPDLPVHPQEALSLLHDVCRREQPHLILGTSMGGMYAEQLYGYDRILMNPAFQIADTMQEHGLTGKQQFQNPRLDGVQEFYVDKPMVKEYRAASEQNFTQAADPLEQQRVVGMFGDADTVVHTRELFCRHYPQALTFHGEHRMNDRSFMHSVLPVIRWVDDRQQGRERPIIYIGVETLSDTWQKPASSAQKAVRMLIERYQVYFVAPSLSAQPARYADTVAWLTEYIDTPAWGHTVFSCQRHLLYGDYLIEAATPLEAADAGTAPDLMATRIVYGSEKFKTWEDIIGYFELLGGQ